MHRTALSLALLCGLAPLALAGGIACQVTLDKSLLLPDTEGVITLALGIERAVFDCGGTALVDPEPSRPGPKVVIERRTAKATWELVKEPWAEATVVDYRPRSLSHAYRLDRGDRLRFSRRVKLDPGTYRVRAVIRLSDLEQHEFHPTSTPFTVRESAKSKAPKKVKTKS